MIIPLRTGLRQADCVLIAQSFVNGHNVPDESTEVVLRRCIQSLCL